MSLSESIPFLFILWLFGVVVSDLKSRKVYNLWIILGILVWIFGVIYYKASLLDSFVALLVISAVLMPFYMLGWMGAGDVKFGVVVGAWLGMSSGLLVMWLGGSVLAGGHALYLLFWPSLKSTDLVQGLLVSLRLGGRLLAIKDKPRAVLFSPASVCLLYTSPSPRD